MSVSSGNARLIPSDGEGEESFLSGGLVAFTKNRGAASTGK